MDFVVSKVVMSVCALLVAGGLAEAVGESMSPNPGADLEGILTDLQETASSLALHGAECSVTWPVPALPSGGSVDMTFRGGSAGASADGAARTMDIRPELHTWAWDGGPVNATVLEELDLASPGLSARSGDWLELSAHLVPVDDSEELLLFVS